MKNKKGFTLVEIVAVIALIGVLMLLIVPNVTKSLKEGRKNLFYDDVVSILASATTTYLYNQSTSSDPSQEFCVDSFQKENSLSIDVSKGTYYKVRVNKYGGVVSLEVGNSDFGYYTTSSSDDGIMKSDIVLEQVSEEPRKVRCSTSPEDMNNVAALYIEYRNSQFTECENVDCALKELYNKF